MQQVIRIGRHTGSEVVYYFRLTYNNSGFSSFSKITNWFRTRNSEKVAEENLYTRWEKDFDLSCVPELGLFEEYLEMGLYSWLVLQKNSN